MSVPAGRSFELFIFLNFYRTETPVRLGDLRFYQLQHNIHQYNSPNIYGKSFNRILEY